MNKHTEKAFHAYNEHQLETEEMETEEMNEVTNLQDETVNKSENASKNDNLSGDSNELVQDEKKSTYPEDVANSEQNSGDINDISNDEANQERLWEVKYAALNDSHLRLIAEFDNYRKRTVREKADLIKTGGASVLTNLLPVMDDFERAMNTLQTTEDLVSAMKGVKLIYDKFINYLSQQGVKMIDTMGQPFNTDIFEAVATFPVSEEDRKGKVIDCIQAGYKLYDKVLRHAKVVVGE